MILTEDDKPIYFPTVPLAGLPLLGAIELAQMTLELEAKRAIEINHYVEQLTVPVGPPAYVSQPFRVGHPYAFPGTFTGRPSFNDYLPSPSVYQVQLHYGPVLTDRPIVIEALLSASPFSTGTQLVQGTDYLLDENGLLSLSTYHPLLTCSYWAGIDPTQDTPIVRQAKSAVAAILRYQVLG